MIKLKVLKGLNISRDCWNLLIAEKQRTDKSYKLIAEEAIKKYVKRRQK